MMRKSVIVAVSLLMWSCAGTAARNEGLLPPMQLAFSGITADIESGIEASGAEGTGMAERVRAEVEAVAFALAGGDASMLVGLDWRTLEGIALQGIRARAAEGSIGQGVAQSKMERIAQFSLAWSRAIGERRMN